MTDTTTRRIAIAKRLRELTDRPNSIEVADELIAADPGTRLVPFMETPRPCLAAEIDANFSQLGLGPEVV